MVKRVRTKLEQQRKPIERVRVVVPPRPKIERIRVPASPPKITRIRVSPEALKRLRPRKKEANRKRLTEENVRSLPLRAGTYYVWDWGAAESARGLHIAIHPSAAKTYRVVYKFPSGKQGAHKLGRVGEMTLAEARERAGQARGLAAKGLDPKAGDPTRSDTFEATFKTYVQDEQIERKGNKEESVRGTEKHVLAVCKPLLHRPVGTITYRDLDELLTAKRKEAPYSANKVHAHLGTFFRWCVRKQHIEATPMLGMPKPFDGVKPRDKPYYRDELADDAVKAVWHAADQMGGERGQYLKLLVILGKRRGVVSRMRWEAIHPETWVWSPPASEQSKGKRAHVTPLPKLVQRVLGGKHLGKGRVFEMPINFGSMQRAVRRLSGIGTWTFHDQRHIATTKMEELLVEPHIARMTFDHVAFSDAHAGYSHHRYLPQILASLELWCAHIEKLLTPSAGVQRLR
jgi:integrase